MDAINDIAFIALALLTVGPWAVGFYVILFRLIGNE
jgi:hypothetical protein